MRMTADRTSVRRQPVRQVKMANSITTDLGSVFSDFPTIKGYFTSENLQYANPSESVKEKLESLQESVTKKDEELETLNEELFQERAAVQELKSEKEISASQQEALLKKLEMDVAGSAPVNSVAAVESRFYRESLNMQKTIYILREQLSHKDGEVEELKETAKRRMKVLAENWRKAEHEVCGLDKLLETVRRVLRRNQSVFSNCEPIKKVLKDLDGVSGEEDVVKPLEPVKTAAW